MYEIYLTFLILVVGPIWFYLIIRLGSKAIINTLKERSVKWQVEGKEKKEE